VVEGEQLLVFINLSTGETKMKRLAGTLFATILAGAAIVSCGGGSSNDGGAGSGGSHAGSTGTAGSTAGSTGTAGSTAGSTGTAGSTAGSTGTAGSTAGAGGSAAGAGGSAAGAGGGAAGAGGAAGHGGAGGSAAGAGGSAAGAGGSAAGAGGGTAGAGGAAPKTAQAEIIGVNNNTISGTATFTETAGIVKLVVNVSGCPAGTHAFHLHANASCENNADAAGAHWVPKGENLTTLTCAADGGGQATFTAPSANYWTIGGSADTDILKHAIVVHAAADPTAGARIGCGVPSLQ
jgi:Cu/Zn superoxide dismutase